MAMPNFVIFYVSDIQKSIDFYSRLLQKNPIQQTSSFAMFAVSEPLMLGLWDRTCVQPKANWSDQFQLHELAFMLPNELQIKQQLHDWQAAGAILIQEITLMDFGWSFTVQDPDGHRLRVLCPASSNRSI
jgi:predicted enzyme related to lactoylglutathione lyase